jgi:GNAT superfamily N-acetyltransferase
VDNPNNRTYGRVDKSQPRNQLPNKERGRRMVRQKRRLRVPVERTARLVTPADAELVTTIITLAFAEDPLWSWVLARSDGQTDHHGAFWRLFLEGAFAYPATWITGGGEATSVWIPPGGIEMTAELEDRLGTFAVEHLGPRADTFFELLAQFEAAHPRDVDHFYLSLLGTHPAHRGNGTGMWLLTHDLEIIDAERAPAYLESSNPANNDRYASVGFEPIGQFAAPDNGPVVTTMWRSPR